MTTNEGGQPSWSEQVRRMPEVLKVEEAAILLRMHHTTVRQHARDGNLPGVTKIGKEYRFSKTELLRFLQVTLEDSSDSDSADSSE